MAELKEREQVYIGEKRPLLSSHSSDEPQYKLQVEYRSKRRCACRVIVVGVVLAVLVGVVLGVTLGLTLGSSKAVSLPQSIKVVNLMQHLKELEEIAKKFNNSRSVENGYNASAEMVIKKLEQSGYTVQTQSFSVPLYQDLAPNDALFAARIDALNYTLKFSQGSQFALLRYSGSTPGGQVVSLILQPVTGGCNASDFSDLVNGSMVLLDLDVSANCTLYTMAFNAMGAGAAAVVFGRGPSQATLAPPTSRVYQQTANSINTVNIPLLGATYNMRETLYSFWSINTSLEVQIRTYTSVTSVYTYNVFASTKTGSDKSTIVMGSHLDSVPAGPGINDNGSGSAANLEIAIQLATREVKNKVMFAFWAAEELGLLGSYHYTMNLTPDQKKNIALNLNFDMLGSPNYVRGVYNGSGASEAIRVQCGTIQALFETYFKNNELAYEIWPFSGRSDYGPFIAQDVNIPAGSIATGADAVKTPEERITYGGLANAILDPCYHAACDTYENVNSTVYEEMAQSAAYVLEELMLKDDLSSFLLSHSSGL